MLPGGAAGLAQVRGRNQLSWEEKFALDIWYVDHCSAWLDLKILAMTFRIVFGGEGVSALRALPRRNSWEPQAGTPAARE